MVTKSEAVCDRHALAAGWGGLIGILGGLIGLGGAEFRLPVLVGIFRLPTLKAIILNKAMSLAVVACALVFRMDTIPMSTVFAHRDVILNLLAGSLVGAWFGAGQVVRMPRLWLDRIVLALLVLLAVLMLSESVLGLEQGSGVFTDHALKRWIAGCLAGVVVGVVAAVLGVAGGELLIPAIVLLYGADIKLAGSLSLAVSFPTMIVGFIRYARSQSFSVLREARGLAGFMLAGSMLGAALGARMLGLVSARGLSIGLGAILLVSAFKVFQHSSKGKDSA